MHHGEKNKVVVRKATKADNEEDSNSLLPALKDNVYAKGIRQADQLKAQVGGVESGQLITQSKICYRTQNLSRKRAVCWALTRCPSSRPRS